MKIIETAKKSGWFDSQPEVTLLKAIELLSEGKASDSAKMVAAAMALSEMLCEGSLEGINHPERVKVENVVELDGVYEVTVTYRGAAYSATIKA